MTPTSRAVRFALWIIVFVVLGCTTGSCRSQGEQKAPSLAPSLQPMVVQGSSSPAGHSSSARQVGDLKLVYPPENAVIAAASTFLLGHVGAGKHLEVDGHPVRINGSGYFAHVVPLQRGLNRFTITEVENPTVALEISISREMPSASVSSSELRLDVRRMEPAVDCGVMPGDILELSIHATPASEVRVQLGKEVVFLRSISAVKNELRSRRYRKSKGAHALLPHTNVGLDAAYGEVFQRWAGAPADLYVGFYQVRAGDDWRNMRPRFTLKHNGKSVSASGTGKVTALTQPYLAQTRHDNTTVRLGPGAARTTPLAQGVRLLVDGWRGDHMRCFYASGKHVWIAREDIVFEAPDGESGPVPHAVARTIKYVFSDDYGATVSIPLSQRLPYQVEQQLKPNRLVLKVYGVTADTDWIAPSAGSDGNKDHDLIDHVTWRQVADSIYEVTVFLKQHRQWGFKVDYNETSLSLHIKAPPRLGAIMTTSDSAVGGRLKGLTICVDPGHGGAEPGSLGCGGIREAEINLAIGLKLQSLLEHEGARVIMTRTTDSDVSLEQRVMIANANNVDVLLSVHNNSLPDGRDPWQEHGTSSYWYHPQAVELAKTLRGSVERELGFVDLSTRWQNLALTRPAAMLAVLVEVGFMINPDEYAVLEQPEGQQKAAQGLLNGLIYYFANASKLPPRSSSQLFESPDEVEVAEDGMRF